MKAIFHYDAGARLKTRFTSLAAEGFEIEACAEEDEDRLAALLPQSEVWLHILKPITAALIEKAPRLRLIQKIGVGVNTIDLAAAQARGIAVCNMPGTNTPAVAEAAVLLMLAALRNLAGLDRACREGQGWAVGGGLQERVGELQGRTVGLVGAGMVPRALVPILRGFGASLVYCSRREHAELGIPRKYRAPLRALLESYLAKDKPIGRRRETRQLEPVIEARIRHRGGAGVERLRWPIIEEFVEPADQSQRPRPGA